MVSAFKFGDHILWWVFLSFIYQVLQQTHLYCSSWEIYRFLVVKGYIISWLFTFLDIDTTYLLSFIFSCSWLLFNFWRTSLYNVFQSLWTMLKFYFGNLSIFFASLVYSLTGPLLFIWMQCLLHFSEHTLECLFVFAFHSFFVTFIICVLG